MKPLSPLVIAALLLALVPEGALAIFEDQVGEIDWYRTNVGPIKFADFHTSSGRKQVFVSTESAIIAALDAQTGAPVWRQVLPEWETVVAQALSPAQGSLAVASVTGDGALMVRLWLLSGELVWDNTIRPHAAAAGSLGAQPVVDFKGGDSRDVLVLWGPSVVRMHGRSGDVSWAWTHSDPAHVSWRAIIPAAAADSAVIVGVSTAGRGGVARAELNLATGSGAESSTAAGGTALSLESVQVVTEEPRVAVTLSADGKSLVIATGVAEGVPSTTLVPVASLGTHPGGGPARLSNAVLPGAVVVELAPTHHAVVDVAGGAARVLWEAQAQAPVATAVIPARGQAVVGCLAPTPEGTAGELKLIIVTPGAASELPSPGPLPLAFGDHGALARFFLGAYAKNEGRGVSVRALAALSTGTAVALSADGSHSWVRDEALASPEQVAFIHLPKQSADIAALSAGPQYGSLLELAKRALGMAPASAALSTRAASRLVSDPFGFRKLLVVRTAASKVVALHADDGAVEWTLLPSVRGATAELSSMAVVASPSGQPTDLLVTGKAADGRHFALILDGLTGLPRGEPAPLACAVLWSAPVPAADAGLLHDVPLAHAFALEDHSVALVPQTMEAAVAFDERVRASSFFFRADRAEGVLRGFGFARRGADATAGFVVVERWTFVPPPSARALSVSSVDPLESVHSPVRVLGNRGVLHKYLNRNLVAAAYTQSSETASAVHLTLLDGVTGAPVYDYVQPHATGPVRVAIAENLIVAHAQATQSGAHFVSVTELYENATEPKIWDMLVSGGDPSDSEPRSSFASRQPFALSAAYYLPGEVATVSITQTAKGITPRHILFALSSGQLLALDKRIVDPRRPKEAPTQADKEEGLMQYKPALGQLPLTSMITHGQQVARPKGVTCAPTILESTAYVALYGTDLYVTRYSPAKTFDMLGESFNYVALVLAVGGLAVLTVVTTFIRRRQEVNRLWR